MLQKKGLVMTFHIDFNLNLDLPLRRFLLAKFSERETLRQPLFGWAYGLVFHDNHLDGIPSIRSRPSIHTLHLLADVLHLYTRLYADGTAQSLQPSLCQIGCYTTFCNIGGCRQGDFSSRMLLEEGRNRLYLIHLPLPH